MQVGSLLLISEEIVFAIKVASTVEYFHGRLFGKNGKKSPTGNGRNIFH